jgi:hypothetical protein
MIRDTSLLVYGEVLKSLGERQRKVFDVISRHPKTSNLEISVLANLPINSVTPRVKELRDLNIVSDAGTKRDSVSGRLVHCWVVNINRDAQLNLL